MSFGYQGTKKKKKSKAKKKNDSGTAKKSKFISNESNVSTKKKGYVKKEYRGLNVLESNMLTFVKLIKLHPDAPPFQ